MRALLTASLLLLGACGGGEGGDSAYAPKSRTVRTDDLAASPEELAERTDLANRILALVDEAEKLRPGVSNWPKFTAPPPGKRDAGPQLASAAWQFKLDVDHARAADETWPALAVYGLNTFQLDNERPPTTEEINAALAASLRLAVVAREYQLADGFSVAAFMFENEDFDYGIAMFQALGALHNRVLLLQRCGETQAAADALIAYIRVLTRTGTYATMLTSLATTPLLLLRELISGELAQHAANQTVQTALAEARATTALQQMWLGELSFVCWKLKQGGKDELIQLGESQADAMEQLEASHRILQLLLDVQRQFPLPGPDIRKKNDYSKLMELARRTGGRESADWVGVVAGSRVSNDNCGWCAWDLYLADVKSPLLGRKDEAAKIASGFDWVELEWGANEVEVKLSEREGPLADLTHKHMARSFKVPLRKPTQD
ncbi:MAG: hypothetical protein IPK87_08730 [Planctomycetes bacterium]|nr:hypothetical protein [Planctomycetota bacterium]